MNNSSGVWKFLGIALVVIIVSLAGGYYFSGGQQHTTTPPKPTEQGSDATPPPSTTTPAVQPHAVASSSEYTAADSPSIDIKEVKPQPGAKKITKPADSEASQTGVSTPNTTTTGTGLITTAGSSTPATSSPTLATTAATTPPPPPADAGDSLSPSIPAPVQPSVDDSGGSTTAATGPIYHVLVGNEFADSRNAHIYASSLQHRGYIAVVESINSGSGTVYKVQVGAYRNRVAAEDEVNQLQQSGFNAIVATDR